MSEIELVAKAIMVGLSRKHTAEAHFDALRLRKITLGFFHPYSGQYGL
jgi:hypothetical protein